MTNMFINRIIKHQLICQQDYLVLPLKYTFGNFNNQINNQKQAVTFLWQTIIQGQFNLENIDVIKTQILNIFYMPSDLSVNLFNFLVNKFYQELIIQQNTIYKTINTQKYVSTLLYCIIEIQLRTFQEEKEFDTALIQNVKLLIIMFVYLVKLLLKLYYQTHCLNQNNNVSNINICQTMLQFFSFTNKPGFQLKYQQDLQFSMQKLTQQEEECLKYILSLFVIVMKNSGTFNQITYNELEEIRLLTYNIFNAEYELFLDEFHDYSLVNYQHMIDCRNFSPDQLKLIICKANNIIIYYISQYNYSCGTLKVLSIWNKKIIQKSILILDYQSSYFYNEYYSAQYDKIEQEQDYFNYTGKQFNHTFQLQQNSLFNLQSQYNESQYTQSLVITTLLLIDPFIMIELLFIDNKGYLNEMIKIIKQIDTIASVDYKYINCILQNLNPQNGVHNKLKSLVDEQFENIQFQAVQDENYPN